MAIFDYKCPSCGFYDNDVFVFSLKSEVKCPVCTSAMARQFTVNRIMTVFKGSGFYCTENAMNKWSDAGGYKPDRNQITAEEARSLNWSHNNGEYNEVQDCSIKPIQGDVVKPTFTKV